MQKILVVEDDKELNQALCYALEKEGYTPVPVFTGNRKYMISMGLALVYICHEEFWNYKMDILKYVQRLVQDQSFVYICQTKKDCKVYRSKNFQENEKSQFCDNVGL